MLIQESLRTSWREIRAHKLRSLLSFSALAVGAASILYTFSQTHGMQEANRKAIELQGPGRMSVTHKSGYITKGLSPGLTLGDAEAIRREMPELFMVSPRVGNHGPSLLWYQGTKLEHFFVQGITPEWRKRDWVYQLHGRFISDWDVRNSARVCVLLQPGTWHKKPYWAWWWKESPWSKFVHHHDLIGKTINLKDHDFVVVGMIEGPPKDLDPRWYVWNEPSVILPITTLSHLFPDYNHKSKGETTDIDSIEIDTGEEGTVSSVKRRVETILRARHRGEEDFEVTDNRQAIQEELNETRKYVVAGLVLGAVALLAGGIGIMNVTLAALFSRVKEIGIRRALGASQADILLQFVVEAALLGFAGGLAGIGLGLLGTHYLQRNAERDLSSITWYHLAGVILVAVAASAVFSFVPAWKASRLDPVEALRSE